MTGDGELGAFAKDSILGEDTPDEWDQTHEPDEGHTEFDFSAPAPKKSVLLKRDETAEPPPPEESNPKITKASVEALVDQVIEEAIPTGQTLKPPAEAFDTAEMAEQPKPAIDDTNEMDALAAPADANATAEMGSMPKPAPAPPAEPPPPPPMTPRPGDVPPAEARPLPTPAPPPPADVRPLPTPPPPRPKDPMATAEMRPQPKPAPAPPPVAAPPLAVRPAPTPAPAPPMDLDDAKATAEMAQPELGERPEPKRRHSVPVGRDVGTEMFDGEAASLQRLVDNSMGSGSEIPVPDELSDEVRAVSKVLMGKKGAAEDTPLPNPMKAESHAALAADLSLDTPRPGATPPATAPIPNAELDPSSAFASSLRRDTPKPTSSPTGTELEAAQDAFDLASGSNSGESLELAFEPKDRPTPKAPPQASQALLDSVEPDGLGFGTKIAIAGIIIAAVIAVLFIVR